jgi:hypothetical protein
VTGNIGGCRKIVHLVSAVFLIAHLYNGPAVRSSPGGFPGRESRRCVEGANSEGPRTQECARQISSSAVSGNRATNSRQIGILYIENR